MPYLLHSHPLPVQCQNYSIPEGVTASPEWSMQAEPNEKDMLSIFNVVKRMKKDKSEIILQEFSDGQQLFEEFEAPKCLCGRVTNVIVWEAQHWALIQRFNTTNTLEMGRFVRFRNAVIKSGTVPSKYIFKI